MAIYIHAATAAKIYKVDKGGRHMRRKAKTATGIYGGIFGHERAMKCRPR